MFNVSSTPLEIVMRKSNSILTVYRPVVHIISLHPCISLCSGDKWREKKKKLCNILGLIKWLVLIIVLNELIMNSTHSIIFVIMSDCRTANCLQLSSHKSQIMSEIRVNGRSDTLKKKKSRNYKHKKGTLTSQDILLYENKQKAKRGTI